MLGSDPVTARPVAAQTPPAITLLKATAAIVFLKP